MPMQSTPTSDKNESAIAYYYFQAKGYSHVRIIEGGCAEFVGCLKPGMTRKQIKARTGVQI